MATGLQLRDTIIVDLGQQGVWRQTDFIPLSARAYRILSYFLAHPHQILPTSLLLTVGWPNDIRTPMDLAALIHRIRLAIEPDPRHPQFLVTRREAGYLLRVTPIPVEFDPTVHPH